MVEPALLRAALADIIGGTVPDARYGLIDPAFCREWTVSPDSLDEMAVCDLMALIKLGAPEVSGRMFVFPATIMITTAAYTGTRAPTDSEIELTAEDRAIGATIHLGSQLEKAALPGGGLCAFTGSDGPYHSEGRTWLSTVLSLSLSVPR